MDFEAFIGIRDEDLGRWWRCCLKHVPDETTQQRQRDWQEIWVIWVSRVSENSVRQARLNFAQFRRLCLFQALSRHPRRKILSTLRTFTPLHYLKTLRTIRTNHAVLSPPIRSNAVTTLSRTLSVYPNS